jgi:hypothetical protein
MKLITVKMVVAGLILSATPTFAAPQWVDDACWRAAERPNGLPSTSSIRHGLTECSWPPHSAQRSRAESCAVAIAARLPWTNWLSLEGRHALIAWQQRWQLGDDSQSAELVHREHLSRVSIGAW